MNIFGFNISRQSRQKRFKTAYQGAIINRLTEDFPISILSADAATRYSLKNLRARAEDLERNGGIHERYLSALDANIIGSAGIKLHVQLNDAASGVDQTTAKAIEQEWAEFGKKGNFDVTGRYSQKEFWRLALRSVARSGNVLALIYRGPTVANRWKIAFQLIEGAYLDDCYNVNRGDYASVISPGNTVRMGVEFNAFRTPVAYWILARHPGDYGVEGVYVYDGKRLRIPAFGTEPGAPIHCIHLTRTKRSEETIGVPWITPAMIAIKMLEGYEEAELVAARAQACKHVFYERDLYTPQGDLIETEDESGQLVDDMEPGGATELPAGTKANFYNPTHPNQAFPDFCKSQRRKISAALNCSYNTLFVDLESVNYSSIRAGLLDERDNWKMIQSWFEDDLVRPQFSAWLQSSLAFGALPFGLSSFDRLQSAQEWKFKRWEWVDPAKDMRANVEGVAAKLSTRSEIWAERGEDFEQKMLEYAHEEKFMRDLGIDPAPIAQFSEQIIDPNVGDNASGAANNDSKPAPPAPAGRPPKKQFRIKRADGTTIEGELNDITEVETK